MQCKTLESVYLLECMAPLIRMSAVHRQTVAQPSLRQGELLIHPYKYPTPNTTLTHTAFIPLLSVARYRNSAVNRKASGLSALPGVAQEGEQ